VPSIVPVATPGTSVQPLATPTAVAPASIPNPGAGQGTRDNPYPLGSSFAIDDWQVSVTSVDLDAWPEIKQENQFNDPPASGHQFVMFAVTGTYNGTETGNPSIDLQWNVVGSQGNTYGSGIDDYCGVIPDAFSDQGELFPGATAAGNVCISVASAQLDGATLHVEQFLGENGVFVALH
jgi:hypothetical protein